LIVARHVLIHADIAGSEALVLYGKTVKKVVKDTNLKRRWEVSHEL